MSVQVDKIEIEYVDINILKPAEYNPRTASEQEVKNLTDSIREFGLVDPIIVNCAEARRNVVLGGHFRLRIAKDMEYTQVPVVYLNIPDIEKEKELNLRLNKNNGSWDFDLLAKFDDTLLQNVGFSSDELDRIFKEPMKEDEFDAEKEYQQITEPSVKSGDLYQLGDHRLLCGNSEKPEDVALLMNGKLARMIFTDPPYNVDYKSPAGLSYDSTKFGGTGGKIFNDDKTDEECIRFYTDVLKNLFKFSTDDVTIYWWFANKNNWINRMAFENAGWHMSQIIIWLKNSMVFSRGQDYHRQYEPCMLGWKKKQAHYKNKKIADLKDVFNLDFTDFSEMMDVWYQKRDPTMSYVHPTQKPVRLAERALKKNSERGDIIVDLFGGSGSTLIACEQLDRKAYLAEIDPKYVQVALTRWCQFTGKKAERL